LCFFLFRGGVLLGRGQLDFRVGRRVRADSLGFVYALLDRTCFCLFKPATQEIARHFVLIGLFLLLNKGSLRVRLVFQGHMALAAPSVPVVSEFLQVEVGGLGLVMVGLHRRDAEDV
jgi:hypothetical protein